MNRLQIIPVEHLSKEEFLHRYVPPFSEEELAAFDKQCADLPYMTAEEYHAWQKKWDELEANVLNMK